MIVPAFRDKTDCIRLRVQQRHQPRVVGRRPARATRHAERGDARTQRPPLREKAGIGRIGAGITGLDVIDTEFVEQAGNGKLIGKRKVDAVRLRAVAQGRVEQIKPFARHTANRDRAERSCKATR
jgi:hypothetical protein